MHSHRQLRTRPRAAVLLAAVLLASALPGCGSREDLEGRWSTPRGSTLEFTGGSALLGQKGTQGADTAAYAWSGDTLVLRTADQIDALGAFHNEFRLQRRGDRLQLLSLSMHRGADAQYTSVETLAQRIGRDPADFSFAREERP
jgi:hypothetical protein